MSISSSRVIQVAFSGDITFSLIQSALVNTTSVGIETYQTLSSGNNTISVPSITGFTVTGLTIVPPAGNTNLIILKGVNGDTGVPLHKTDPTSLALDTTFSSLVLNAAGVIAGVRLIWS